MVGGDGVGSEKGNRGTEGEGEGMMQGVRKCRICEEGVGEGQ